MSRPEGIVIAMDGPAASGKSSTARAVAAQLGYRHLDSGAFYRAVTLVALDRRIPPESWPDLPQAELSSFGIDARPAPGGYVILRGGRDVGKEIRSPAVNANVSIMAASPAVREWLLETLREKGRAGGLVADGRDIGTVVFPDAELKIFLVCDPEERAERRLRQAGNRTPSRDQIRAEARLLVERDQRDQSREVAPLLRAPDAVVLDTTGLDFGAQVRAVTRLARDVIGS